MRLTLIFAAILITSQPAFSQPPPYNHQADVHSTIKSGNPNAVAPPALGRSAECPPGSAANCSPLQYESDKRPSDKKFSRHLLNSDIKAAKRKWVRAKIAYKKNPSAENELAMTEAAARLRALIAKRRY